MRYKKRFSWGYTGGQHPYETGLWQFGGNFIPPRGTRPLTLDSLISQAAGVTSWTPYTPPLYLGWEEIAYHGREVEPKLQRGREPDVVLKDCFHRKLGFINIPCSWYWIDPGTLAVYGYYYYYLQSRLPVYYSNWITDSQLILPTVNTEAMSSRAWWSMQPRFEGEISMLNFVYEMKDFRDIAKYALRQMSGNLWDNLLKSFRKSLPELAAQPTKTAAQLHLANEFALKPLCADLVHIGQMLCELVDEAQSLFAETGSKYQKKHYTETIGIQGSWIPGENNDSNYRFMKFGNVTKDTFTATLRYTYKYNVRDSLAAFTRYWGLRPTGEVLWNALPFTFLFDYVIKVGQSLKAMELDPNVTLTYWQYCESVKRSLYAGAVGREHPWVHYLIIDDKPVDKYEDKPISGYFGSVYSRTVCRPNRGLYIPRVKWPDGRQAANMAALLRCFL